MEPNEIKPLSAQEMNAFMSGLSFCLSSKLPEQKRMKIGMAITKDKIDNPDEPDFYQLFEQYKQQGHSAEESEEMAGKVILGRVSLPTDYEILENS